MLHKTIIKLTSIKFPMQCRMYVCECVLTDRLDRFHGMSTAKPTLFVYNVVILQNTRLPGIWTCGIKRIKLYKNSQIELYLILNGKVVCTHTSNTISQIIKKVNLITVLCNASGTLVSQQ